LGIRGKRGVEINGMYCSPNIIRVIKLRRMRWAGHIASMGEGRGECRVLVGKRDHLEDLCVDVRIILKWIKKLDGEAWTGSIWLSTGTGSGLL
jgi:hypothetical protein